MEREDFALDGLLRELARTPESDDAFVRRVLARTQPRPGSRRALFFIAAAGLFAALGFLFEPAPTARMGFARQACLVPEAKSMRLLTMQGGLLGEVPIGAQVRVPANTVLLLQAVGADGMAVWTDREELRLKPREVRGAPAGPVATLRPKSVDYRRDVKPILDQYCVGCHAENDLLASAKPFDARHSALVTQIHGLLPAPERRQLALWVDLGAARP